KDSTASISGIASPSRLPPASPASSPIRLPAATAMATETKPATSEMRLPQMTRESTSRPTLSVPSRWAGPGRARLWPRSCLSGSYGDTSGASSATATAASITAAPSGASRALAARRSTRQRSRARRAGAPAARRVASTGSAIRDPGVDPAEDHVDQEAGQDEADRDQEDDALHQGVVPREDGIDHQPADAGQGEDVLGDHRPADQRAE